MVHFPSETHLIRSDTLRKWILFLSLLLSGGVLLVPRVPVLLLIFALYLLMPGAKSVVDRRLLPVFVLLCVILLLSILRTGNLDPLSLVIRYANFVAAIVLLNLYLRQDPDALAKDLYPILKLMAIQAIATVILGYTVGFLFWTVPYEDEVIHTLGLLFNYHIVLEDSSAIRPDGFFYEPGVFQIYLNLYLYLALFVFRGRWNAVLAALAVVSTQSTTGILILILLLGRYFLERLRGRNLSAKFASIIVGGALAIPLALIARQNIAEKLTGDLQGSSWAREYDLYTGINVIAENWLVGIGFDQRQYLDATRRLGYEDTPLKERLTLDRGNTNGIIYLLYSLGIPLSIPFLVGMFRQRFFRHRILFGCLLFLSLFGESIIFTPFFLMFTFSGLMSHWSARRILTPQQAGAA